MIPTDSPDDEMRSKYAGDPGDAPRPALDKLREALRPIPTAPRITAPQPVEPRTWDYRVAAVKRVVDGDTFDLTLEKVMDFGFYLVQTYRWSSRFRLTGPGGSFADAYETNEAGGAAATRYAEAWIDLALEDDVLRGQSYKTDNFGRWLLDLYRADTAEHLAAAMIATGHAVGKPRR